MKLLSLFSGIGAFEKALERLGINYTLVNYCEVDKYASKAYSLIHNVPESLNLWDITKVNEGELPGVDLVTYGFPCQDISVNGKKMGLEYNGEKTRSGLVFDALRIIKATNPKYAVCENVKNLTGKKFTKEFNYILDCLNEMGYNNYWKVLNAADYGIPQRRERVFIISIRKDIDKGFNFPAPFPLTKSLKDVLENEVEDRYFMRDDKVKDYIKHFKSVTPYGTEKDGTCRTIKANYYKTSQANFLQNDDRIATGVVVPQLTELTSGMPQAKRVYDVNGLSVTLKGEAGGLGARTGLYKIENRIRKLTPKECFRLMGFEDRDIEVCKEISNTQLYKMAGNSIVVDVLYYIFKELFKNENC